MSSYQGRSGSSDGYKQLFSSRKHSEEEFKKGIGIVWSRENKRVVKVIVKEGVSFCKLCLKFVH